MSAWRPRAKPMVHPSLGMQMVLEESSSAADVPSLCYLFSEDSALKLISPKHVRNAFHRVLAKPRLALPPALLFASRFACTWP